MEQTAGKQSISFTEPVHIISSASVVGPKEGEGPLGDGFDLIAPEADFGEETWEQAESTMQQEALQLAIGKAGLKSRDIRYLFGGDLLAQLTATSFGSEETQIPLFGLYSACSTCGEALALAALTVSAGCAEHVAAVTSSHFGSAEKEFRLPLGYGSQRPLSATWTVTGSGAFVLGKKGGHVRISGVTPGKIVDMGTRDNMNVGLAWLRPPVIRLSGIYRILDGRRLIMTGSSPEISEQWESGSCWIFWERRDRYRSAAYGLWNRNI